MGDDGHGELLDVLGHDKRAAVQQRQGLGRPHERERGAGARAELHPGHRARLTREVHGVSLQLVAHAYVLDALPEPEHVVHRHARRDVVERVALGLGREDGHLLLGGDVPEGKQHREPVHLRLGQGVRAAELDRILGGDDEEEVRELERAPFDRHLALGHGLEERRLGPRRGAVDLVRQQDVREDRALVEMEGVVALVEHRHAQDIRRQEIRRELDALEGGADRPRERLGERRLPDAREVLDDQVALGEEREHGEPKGLVRGVHDQAEVVLDARREVGRPSHLDALTGSTLLPDNQGPDRSRPVASRRRRTGFAWRRRIDSAVFRTRDLRPMRGLILCCGSTRSRARGSRPARPSARSR